MPRFLKETKWMEKRLILYQIWVVPWKKQAFSEGSMMFKSKAQHFETLEVTCLGRSEVSLWIEAEEEDLISLLDDVIHSQIDSFLKQVMEFFSYCCFLCIPVNETMARSEDSWLLASIYYVHTVSSKKKQVYFKGPLWKL